jgi:serine/threonine-protein kinase HipA
MMNTAIIHIWGKMAGAVAWDEKSGVASFEYDPTFKSLGWELSPLKIPLSTVQQIYSFPELRKENGSSFDTFKGLPGLLADLFVVGTARTTGKQHEPGRNALLYR